MSLIIRVKESRLSDDGRFFLRAVRCQSAQAEIALRPDVDGYIALDLGKDGEKLEILVREGDEAVRWTIPTTLIDAYRAFQIGSVKLANRAGRELAQFTVVGMRWTIPGWIEEFGSQFGVRSQTYVRQMCRGQTIGLSGKNSSRKRKPHQAKLPSPFRGVRDAGRWFITI